MRTVFRLPPDPYGVGWVRNAFVPVAERRYDLARLSLVAPLLTVLVGLLGRRTES